MTDADVDGSHIDTLLLTFLYRFMPELVTQGPVAYTHLDVYKRQEGDQWVYLDSHGDRVTDSWKKSASSNWFYLDEDGYMAVNRLIEDDDDYYYVNEDGAMVKNEWRKLEDDSDDDAYTDGTCWYYFGSSGKAEKNDKGRARLTTINGKKYAFSDTGKMQMCIRDRRGPVRSGGPGQADIVCRRAGQTGALF